MFTRKKCYVGIVMALLMSVLFGTAAYAAANPFKPSKDGSDGWLPKKTLMNEILISTGFMKGCDYMTPGYPQDFKMTATSSNKKVATVRVVNLGACDIGYCKGIEVIKKAPGTTNIKVTVMVGGKTFKKTFKYKLYKYENPFASFKVGGKDYMSKFNKLKKDYKLEGGYVRCIRWSAPGGKLDYKAKKGYKITRIICTGSDYSYNVVKNKGTIPEGCSSVSIEYKNKKTGAVGTLSVHN